MKRNVKVTVNSAPSSRFFRMFHPVVGSIGIVGTLTILALCLDAAGLKAYGIPGLGIGGGETEQAVDPTAEFDPVLTNALDNSLPADSILLKAPMTTTAVGSDQPAPQTPAPYMNSLPENINGTGQAQQSFFIEDINGQGLIALEWIPYSLDIQAELDRYKDSPDLRDDVIAAFSSGYFPWFMQAYLQIVKLQNTPNLPLNDQALLQQLIANYNKKGNWISQNGTVTDLFKFTRLPYKWENNQPVMAPNTEAAAPAGQADVPTPAPTPEASPAATPAQ